MSNSGSRSHGRVAYQLAELFRLPADRDLQHEPDT
jgi:hypothetical protein